MDIKFILWSLFTTLCFIVIMCAVILDLALIRLIKPLKLEDTACTVVVIVMLWAFGSFVIWRM